MFAFIRCSLLAVLLLAIAGCTPLPPTGPVVDGGYAPNARARGFIDAQFASRPTGTEPSMTGDEADVIYRNYLRSIGSRPLGSDGLQGAGGGPGATGTAGGSRASFSGGSEGSYR